MPRQNRIDRTADAWSTNSLACRNTRRPYRDLVPSSWLSANGNKTPEKELRLPSWTKAWASHRLLFPCYICAQMLNSVSLWLHHHALLLEVVLVVLAGLGALYADTVRHFVSLPPQRLGTWVLKARLLSVNSKLFNLCECHNNSFNTLVYVARSLVFIFVLIGLFLGGRLPGNRLHPFGHPGGRRSGRLHQLPRQPRHRPRLGFHRGGVLPIVTAG